MIGSGDPDSGRALERFPLLERQHELGVLQRLLEGGAGELPGPAVVEGPAGIGKTRLLTELRRVAPRHGLRPLAARGSDLEREFPFGMVRQLFEPALGDAESRRRLLDDAAAPAESIFSALTPAADDEGDVSFAALHGLYWLTANLAAEEPLLLVVDDLHWCDRPSLRFLAYLSRRLEGLAAVMAVGLRTAEPGTDPVLIGEIAASPDVLHLHPGPLSEDAVAEMIRARLEAEPHPAFVAACHSATGGNPLLLRQLLTSLDADGVRPEAGQADAVEQIGPRAVSRTVLQRLRRLPQPATATAQAVAVLGAGAELPHVAALANSTEATVAAMSAELARTEILRPEPPLDFVHPLVRDAVYHGLPPVERELLHADAARRLIEARAPTEMIATHLLASPRRGQQQTVEVLGEAARTARRKGAADSAVAYLQRALQEPPDDGRRAELLLELGLAETLVSGPAAATHLREAWASLGDPRQKAMTAATLSRTLLFTAPGDEAYAVARQALADAPAELVDERQALRALELMAVFFGTGDQSAMTRSREVQIQGDGPGAKMLGAMTAFVRALIGAPVEECVPLALRALAGDVLIEVDPGLFPVAAIAVLVLGDRDDALTTWEHLRALAHRRGSLLGVVTERLWGGWTFLWRGELREAEETLLMAQAELEVWGLVQSSLTYVPAFLGLTYLQRGNLVQARQLLDQPPMFTDATDGNRHLLRSQAELRLFEGRHQEALAIAEDLQARLTFIANPAWSPWRSLKARALDGLGRTEEATALALGELELAQRFGAPGLVGRSMALLGRLERSAGIARLEEAVQLLRESSAKLELATALLSLGSALRRERRPTQARDPLREALELAEKLGAEPVAAQARSELYAAGGRPRTVALGGAASLTPSERRVADLAVDGRSNKEIAQALYVTPKTVEVHLSNAYRKLDIRSRRDLQQALVG